MAQNKYGYPVGSLAIGVASSFCGWWAWLCNGGGQAAWAGFSGRSFNESLKTGVIAGATTYAYSEVGTWTKSGGAQTWGDKAWNVAGHAAVGCGSSSASGGSCRDGAMSAGLSAAYTNVIDGGGFARDNRVLGTIEHAMVGGLASVAGGGKFATAFTNGLAGGAMQGAFGYLFNECAHSPRCGAREYGGYARLQYPDGTDVIDPNTGKAYATPSIDIRQNLEYGKTASALQLSNQFCCGGDMDYQRPNGFGSAWLLHDVAPQLVNIGNYNYGAVLAANGYGLVDSLNKAGEYVRFVNSWGGSAVAGPAPGGISIRAYNNIAQGWLDYKNGKWGK